MNKASQVLEKIIAHIQKTIGYCADKSYDDFLENTMLQEACVFNVLQIGELSNLLDRAFFDQYPDIPWRSMYGMRNRLVHDYDGVKLRIVWDTITEDFPKLLPRLKEIHETLNQ